MHLIPGGCKAEERKIIMEKKKVGLMAAIGILSISGMGMGSTVLTPAMNVLGEHFVGKDVSFAMTMGTLGVVLGSFIGGAIAGKLISAKNLAILGNILCLVLGCLPMMFDNFTLLLVDRFIFGVCLGLITPLANILIAQNYEGDAMSRMMGFTSMFMSLGGIVFQLLGGILADMDWQMTFLAHAFFIVSAILCLFIPKDEVMTKEQAAAMKNAGSGDKMNVKVVMLVAIILLVFQTINMSVMMMASTLYAQRGFGGATEASIALTMYTVAGVVSGLLFGKLFNGLKRLCMPLMMLIVAAGAAVILASTSHMMCVIGFILIGLGFMSAFPGMTTWIAMVNPLSKVGTGTSIAIAFMNLGGFLCSFWMIAMGYDITKLIIADIAVSVIIAVIFMFASPFVNKEL